MSQFAREALFIGFKEGLILAVSLFVILSYLRSAGLDGLKKPIIAGILAVFAASLSVLTIQADAEIRDAAVRMTGYSFGLFYLLSLGALFHATGTDMLGPFSRLFRTRVILVPCVFFLSLLYYVPDMAGSSLYVAHLFSMSGNRAMVFIPAATGLFLAVLVFVLLVRRAGPKIPMHDLFGLPQVLLFLALLKLLSGGVRGFAELSLIPSVQAGLTKLIHDVVHQTFVTIMVPDHEILTTTAWNFIGILFGHTVTLWLSLVILVAPLLLFIKKHFSEEALMSPPARQAQAVRRLYIKSFRDKRLLKSLPVFAFLLVIMSVWFVEKGESTASLYNPAPRPVIAAGSQLSIPLQAPGEDLRDGSLHKFSLAVNGEIYRLLVMKKPDGTLAVCLDACEICRPEGYGQGRDHVVCLYCNTPIPFDTIGRTGGCNPIPLDALVTEKDLIIEVSEIREKWQTVDSGKNEEKAAQ